LGIDISVLSWTKTRSRKEGAPRNATKRNEGKNVHGLVDLFVPNDPLFADRIFWPLTGLQLVQDYAINTALIISYAGFVRRCATYP
jgi:hypothetical protein